jgi:hypothetical protein
MKGSAALATLPEHQDPTTTAPANNRLDFLPYDMTLFSLRPIAAPKSNRHWIEIKASIP